LAVESQRVAALVQRLRELGWTEDRTVAIEYRWRQGRIERAAEIAAEFVRLKVDVIVTLTVLICWSEEHPSGKFSVLLFAASSVGVFFFLQGARVPRRNRARCLPNAYPNATAKERPQLSD
jgi:hypothetical protein